MNLEKQLVVVAQQTTASYVAYVSLVELLAAEGKLRDEERDALLTIIPASTASPNRQTRP